MNKDFCLEGKFNVSPKCYECIYNRTRYNTTDNFFTSGETSCSVAKGAGTREYNLFLSPIRQNESLYPDLYN